MDFKGWKRGLFSSVNKFCAFLFGKGLKLGDFFWLFKFNGRAVLLLTSPTI
jgi:hypothetical protein